MLDGASTLIPPPAAAVSEETTLVATIAYHPDRSRIGEVAVVDGDEIELSRTTPAFARRVRSQIAPFARSRCAETIRGS